MIELKFGDICIADLSLSIDHPKISVAPVVYMSTRNNTDGINIYIFCRIGKSPSDQSNRPFIPIDKHPCLRNGSAIFPTQTVSFRDMSTILSRVGYIEDEKIKTKILAISKAARDKKRHTLIMTLCPRCRSEFLLNPETQIRRYDPCTSERYQCDFCQMRTGYVYEISIRKLYGGEKSENNLYRKRDSEDS